MSRIYLDASVIIYIVEAESPFHEAALQSVQRFRSDSESQLITSRLSRLECRVKPVRDSDARLVVKYDAFFERRHPARGHTRLQWSRDRVIAETQWLYRNGVTTEGKLQWSRDRVIAETRRRRAGWPRGTPRFNGAAIV